MKKVLTFFLLAALLMITQPMAAQIKLRLGVTGGIALKKTDIESSSLEKANWKGWYAGPTLELSLPLGFKVDGSVEYSHHELESGSEKLDLNYITIPLNLKYNFSFARLLGLYVSAGPQFENHINGDEHDIFHEENFKIKQSSLSLNVGAGVRLLNHVQVGVYYNIPQKKESESEDNVRFKQKDNTWRVQATILF